MANLPNKAEDSPRRGILEHQAPEGDSVSAGSHGFPALKRGKTVRLAIAALGVVFGGIGTSPLYAVRECFNGPHAIALTESKRRRPFARQF